MDNSFPPSFWPRYSRHFVIVVLVLVFFFYLFIFFGTPLCFYRLLAPTLLMLPPALATVLFPAESYFRSTAAKSEQKFTFAPHFI